MEGRVGRYRLKGLLDLYEHEGLVRLMLSELAEKGYIKAEKTGCSMTPAGERYLASVLSKVGIGDIRRIDLSELQLGPACVAVQICDRQERFSDGIEQRDSAVRAGARGATVLLFKDNVFSVPRVYHNLSAEYPGLAREILDSFRLKDGDALIVGFADSTSKALEGALAAALEQ